MGYYFAQVKYTEALDVAPEKAKERSVYFANRAACKLQLKQFELAARDCTAALDFDAVYIKALLRRSSAYEQLDDLERALGDAEKVHA